MATYSIVTERRTVQVLSQTQVVDVQEVGFFSEPSNTYCQVVVPVLAWAANGPAAWVQPLADAIEGLIPGSGATSASFVQDVDSSNLIADFLDFTVTYTPTTGFGLPLSTVVRVPIAYLTLDPAIATAGGLAPAEIIGKAYARLVADAGLT